MLFQFRSPHLRLQRYVQYYTYLIVEEAFDHPRAEKIPPILGKSICFWTPDSEKVWVQNDFINIVFPRAYIMPQATQSKIWIHYGGFGLFEIVFWPGMMRWFFSENWEALADRILPITKASNSRLVNFYLRINEENDFDSKCKIADDFLFSFLPSIKIQRDLLTYTLKRIGNFSKIEILADQLGYTSRHVRRYFKAQMGISPKSYFQVIRIQRAIELILHNNGRRLSQVAYSCGYSDQAHLCRIFKEFTGLSPKHFYKYHTARLPSIITL